VVGAARNPSAADGDDDPVDDRCGWRAAGALAATTRGLARRIALRGGTRFGARRAARRPTRSPIAERDATVRFRARRHSSPARRMARYDDPARVADRRRPRARLLLRARKWTAPRRARRIAFRVLRRRRSAPRPRSVWRRVAREAPVLALVLIGDTPYIEHDRARRRSARRPPRVRVGGDAVRAR
jgi:hypothetical protein